MVFLKILQNLQENTCARVSLSKKRLWHRCFPVNIVKFSETPFLQNSFGRLLLDLPALDTERRLVSFTPFLPNVLF